MAYRDKKPDSTANRNTKSDSTAYSDAKPDSTARRGRARRLCLDGLLLAAALMLSYLEAVLGLSALIPLPGFKPGFANLIVTLAFAAISPLDAAMISLGRILLMGLLFGNAASLAFSLGGGILSYLGLWLLARAGKRCFSMLGVSVGCAALHNIGQLTVAALWLGSNVILGYLPMLLFASILFGAVTGILLELTLPRFSRLTMKNIKGDIS